MKDQHKNSLNKLESCVSDYKCAKCRDLTFIIEGDVARACECRDVMYVCELLKLSGISKEFRNKTFDSFNYFYDVQVANAYKRAKDYCNDFFNIRCSKKNSIMFLGQVGCGKSHLSMAVANSLMGSAVGVLYMSYREDITSIKQCVIDKSEYDRIVGRYKNASVLLIDDLFKGSITKSDVNIMFEIVNFRYFNNLPIIVSCERSIEDILNIDEAIGSRLLEMGEDYLIRLNGKRLNYRIYKGRS